MMRSVLLSAALSLWFGLYFTMDLAQPLWTPFAEDAGDADLFMAWGLERIVLGLESCLAIPDPLGCLTNVVAMTWAAPGFVARSAICGLGAGAAAWVAQARNQLDHVRK